MEKCLDFSNVTNNQQTSTSDDVCALSGQIHNIMGFQVFLTASFFLGKAVIAAYSINLCSDWLCDYISSSVSYLF